MASRRSESFRPERPAATTADDMKSTLVRYSIDLANPPPLTPDQEAELAALADRPDSEIDYSDIPPLTEKFWANAVLFRGRHLYRPVKKSTTLRVDADVLEWLKAKGRGYQTRINAILREAMMKDVAR